MVVGERLVADSTHMLLGAMLYVHVPVELGIREKTLIADLAVPRVLLEMTPMVSGQLRSLNKCSTAHVTNKVLLVSVNSLVYC